MPHPPIHAFLSPSFPSLENTQGSCHGLPLHERSNYIQHRRKNKPLNLDLIFASSLLILFISASFDLPETNKITNCDVS